MADVLILSTADWDHPLWTNKQHLAVSLADLGHRVVYVESLGIRTPRIKGGQDLRRIARRLRHVLVPLRLRQERIWVLSPPVIPGLLSGRGLRMNRWILQACLAMVSWRLRFSRVVLWTFNPFAARYFSLNHFDQTVYHCVDRIQAQPGMPIALLDAAERDLCGRVDVVFTTAPRLQENLAPLNPATYWFGNVADVDHFSGADRNSVPRPDDLPLVKGPLLIFIGAIDAYKLDLTMLTELMVETPSWTYVLIGPVGESDPSTDITVLNSLDNVHLLGTRAYQFLPAYLAYADVALLPLRRNDYTSHMFPMKFFEYLASGCPVVGTSIPSLEDQADVATLCEPTRVGFEAAIRSVLAGEIPPLKHRLARASEHTYSRRTQAMLRCLPRPLE
ncbi:MAG: glycosyl transferase [Propionibacteriaceae bacterium]|nr:glycosyl transferase [Propionibacteriaceae bacterium]